MRELPSQLIGKPVDESLTVFPPFYSDFGKNITLGKRIFINSGCKLQDQGGIIIGDDCLIGHNVWIGANVTVVPGVNIGDNLVIGAASVVTKDVAANSIAVGSPARVIRSLAD